MCVYDRGVRVVYKMCVDFFDWVFKVMLFDICLILVMFDKINFDFVKVYFYWFFFIWFVFLFEIMIVGDFWKVFFLFMGGW